MKKVRIKTWDEMVKISKSHTDFRIGLQDDFFISTMESDLPKDRIIEINDKNIWNRWTITEEMIAEVIEDYTRKDILDKILDDFKHDVCCKEMEYDIVDDWNGIALGYFLGRGCNIAEANKLLDIAVFENFWS
jgi:hypothetical protein